MTLTLTRKRPEAASDDSGPQKAGILYTSHQTQNKNRKKEVSPFYWNKDLSSAASCVGDVLWPLSGDEVVGQHQSAVCVCACARACVCVTCVTASVDRPLAVVVRVRLSVGALLGVAVFPQSSAEQRLPALCALGVVLLGDGGGTGGHTAAVTVQPSIPHTRSSHIISDQRLRGARRGGGFGCGTSGYFLLPWRRAPPLRRTQGAFSPASRGKSPGSTPVSS